MDDALHCKIPFFSGGRHMEVNLAGTSLAVLDALGNMTVYDLRSGRGLFEAHDVTSLAFNAGHAEVRSKAAHL